MDFDKLDRAHGAMAAAHKRRQLLKEERHKSRERPDGLTDTAFARQRGVSRQYVESCRDNGTSDEEFAEDLATHFGGEAADYLRRDRRGRPAQPLPFPFSEFMRRQNWAKVIAAKNTPAVRFMLRLYKAYKTGDAPHDFESLGDLLTFATREAMTDQTKVVARAWDAFCEWRVECVRKELMTRISLGDGVDSATMRALLSALSVAT
jgi:hypothetical protein